MMTMKFFITNQLFFKGFLLLSTTTPTLNDMNLRSNGLKNRRIYNFGLAKSIDPP